MATARAKGGFYRSLCETIRRRKRSPEDSRAAGLKAPLSGVHAKAAYMEYSVADRYVTLKSDQHTPQATLQQGEQHFTAPQLHYQMADEGRLGKLHANGPGDLRMVQQGERER